MICPSCGAEAADDAAFCTKCGVKLEAPKTETSMKDPSTGVSGTNCDTSHEEVARTDKPGPSPVLKGFLIGAAFGFVIGLLEYTVFTADKDDLTLTFGNAMKHIAMTTAVGSAFVGALSFGAAFSQRQKRK